MTYKYNNIAFISIVVAIALVFSILFSSTKVTNASAPSGLQSTLATTSQETVSTTAISVFATSTCSSRVISTAGQSVMITFGDQFGQTPTGTFGHLQLGSTTVAYDSGVYGCGLLKIYGFSASSVITVSEFR